MPWKAQKIYYLEHDFLEFYVLWRDKKKKGQSSSKVLISEVECLRNNYLSDLFIQNSTRAYTFLHGVVRIITSLSAVGTTVTELNSCKDARSCTAKFHVLLQYSGMN